MNNIDNRIEGNDNRIEGNDNRIEGNDNRITNNDVRLAGKIVDGFKYSHEMYGEAFYLTTIEAKRMSGSVDEIPVTVSERLIDVTHSAIGKIVEIKGQFRSYNKHNENGTSNLILSVFARELRELEESESIDLQNDNSIHIDGYICKPPVFRITPAGMEIADILVAVNRPYGKSDYLPCITWGRNAKFISKLDVGTHINASGRVQSRRYMKRLPDESIELIAYEVSLGKIEVVNEDSEMKA